MSGPERNKMNCLICNSPNRQSGSLLCKLCESMILLDLCWTSKIALEQSWQNNVSRTAMSGQEKTK
jgi:hypothetical protein